MRKFVFFIFLIFFLATSCNSPDDVNTRLDFLEAEIKDLKTALYYLESAYKDGKIIKSITPNVDADGNECGWIILFSDETSITLRDGTNGDSFIEKVEIQDNLAIFTLVNGSVFRFMMYVEPRPKLLCMEFLASSNPMQLINNVSCQIEGDSLLTCWIPIIIADKKLIPHFTFEGDYVSVDDTEVISDETRVDFSKPVSITVGKGDKETEYTVLVHSFTGLPILRIDTENRQPVESKEEYINAHFLLTEDVLTRAAGDIQEGYVQIKGRGNTTWNRFPKKPYRLKFEEKISLLDEPKDKSWVLLANYADKSLLRNDITFYMGSISNLEYTPTSHFVELFLNGAYQGTYQLTDKIKIAKHRVNVGNDGFLLEIDDYAPKEMDSRYFRVNHLNQPCINVKDPSVEYDDENYTYVKQFVLTAEAALFSENFTDLDVGWQKYMDIDTFVDYYIICEITKNTDSMWGSTFMSLKRNGKLKMGPLWDYDLAFGNYSGIASMASSEGFKLKGNQWYSRLFEDPVFVSKVKERYDYFYNRKNDILDRINTIANYLYYSVVENDNKWGVLYLEGWPNVNAWGCYQNEVQFLKEWLCSRMDWLKMQYDSM